jgi:methionyl-tRNA synthetase
MFKAKRVTVTSALPYVNGVKHLGNIVGSILPADVFHRFLDIMGIDNIYICGTDEHGTAVELAAAEERLSPEEYSRKYHEVQKKIYEQWHFDFTFFGRTSSENNSRITQELFLSAYENGYILAQDLVIPYCPADKRFLPDRYVTGICPDCGYDRARGDQCERCVKVLDPADLKEPKCSLCGSAAIEFRKEKHLFLNLPMLQGRLGEWIRKQEQWPENTRSLALGWLKEGLKPRCITRNLTWGIKVPLTGFEHLVFYVWYDAPIGYISMTKDANEAGAIKESWKHYWKDSRIYHFLGKDNIPFHTVIWPSIILAGRDSEQRDTNYLLPYYVAGYEYLNWEGKKFSTSQGIGLFSDEVLDLFPADYWRFYLLSILPESKDSNFDWDDFRARINNELIANYGNLFYRVTYFIEKYFDGRIPQAGTGEEEDALFARLARTKEEVGKLIEEVRLREALQSILALASATNKYFQDKKPWAVIETDKDNAGTALFAAVNVLRALSVLLYPYIPESSERALKALNSGNKKFSEIGKLQLTPGEPVRAVILFKKIEKEDIEKAKKHRSKYSKTEKKEAKEEGKETINLVDDMLPIEEFRKVNLRAGTIKSVREHPNADKLYVLDVDLGEEQRQLVAGLRQVYEKEELAGKQIIIVTNLEQKEVRGVLSQGMLLAAEDGTIIEPAKQVRNGSRIV